MLVCMAAIGKEDRSMSWQVAQRAVDFCLEHTMNMARLLGRPPEAHLGFFGCEPGVSHEVLCVGNADTEGAEKDAEGTENSCRSRGRWPRKNAPQ